MATGVVSGMVADLLQAHSTLTPDQVKARLMKTASKTFPSTSSVYDPTTGITYTSQYDIFTVGAGYVDLAAALADTELPTRSAMSPTAVYNSNTGKVTLTTDSSAVWGTSQAWSGPAVWGSSQFVGGQRDHVGDGHNFRLGHHVGDFRSLGERDYVGNGNLLRILYHLEQCHYVGHQRPVGQCHHVGHQRR